MRLEGSNGDNIRLRTLGPGAIVGELAFYLGIPRGASVIADTRGIAWRLTKQNLERMREQDPAIASKFHESMVIMLAQRLTNSNNLVRSLVD